VLAFICDSCGQQVFFDNDECLRCGSPLGYVPTSGSVVALATLGADRLVELADPDEIWQRCATFSVTGCNWLVPEGEPVACRSCALTRTRPADDDVEGMRELIRAESAKRRLIFQLDELELPIETRNEAKETGLAFDLLSSTAQKVITGHDEGIITLDLAEADDEHREQLRLHLNEPYRTLLGHFRHEIGHYYWPILVDRPDEIDECRDLFGDDRADYAEAIKHHYESDPESNEWQSDFISRYATMHPFEDWAETFAHYLHMLDTLQTAESFGLRGPGPSDADEPRTAFDATRPDHSSSFEDLVDHWLEMTYALNQVSRSMGRDDLYPFVLPPTVIKKMAFVDRVVRSSQSQASSAD
jgi:hypothetical protein